MSDIILGALAGKIVGLEKQIATLPREREAWIAASKRQTLQIVDMTQQFAEKDREIERGRLAIQFIALKVQSAQFYLGNGEVQIAQDSLSDAIGLVSTYRAEQAKRESKEGGDEDKET